MIGTRHRPRKGDRLDGIAAAATANATGQVAAALQVFALKQANEAQASTVAQLLQSLPSPASAGPAHLGNRVDVSA
jgi:hypothetical protein